MIRKTLYICFLLVMALPMMAKRHQPAVPDSLQRLVLRVNDIPLTMRRVEGGSFMMGGTIDQTDKDLYTDKPVHLVFLSPYYIAETEVTYQLWRSVMPDKESLSPRGYPTNPISYVTWYDCKEFVRRLDSITGLPFRLPTEAEWEYAARGGQYTEHQRYAGGQIADSVGWTNSNSGNWSHPVARRQANELGLYDMTGNVAEWCEDVYSAYSMGTTTDPCVCDTGSYRIARGGSYDDCVANSHISVRRWYTPETSRGYLGLRVALTLPNDPRLQPVVEPEQLPLTKRVKLKGKKLTFQLVPGETPYYISEEIPTGLWRKMTRQDPPKAWKGLAVGMTKGARMRFAEQCSREANTALTVATPEEIVHATKQGIIPPYQKTYSQEQRQEVRHTQRKRRTNKSMSAFTELFGVKLPQPDDPVLLQFKTEDDDSRPLRLVIH